MSASPRQLPLPYLPPPLPLPAPASFQSRISPSVLLIILILAVIFFVSGLLHLLVRFLFRPAAPRDADGGATATAFHGQLQQLFHLHDAGVDQSFIDALPVFLYGAVVGGKKDPFDCAVCLCEFAADDRLRLLPKCSHAFHVDCIDTWLLSHSTCPLCRRSLLADLDDGAASSSAHLSLVMEQQEEEEEEAWKKHGDVVVPVKLGKFRSQAGEGCNSDVRRCYSMGTYEYVMDQTALLRVSVKPPPPPPKKPHRVAMSSFRLPRRAASDIGKRRGDGVVSPVTESEYNVSAWDNGSVADDVEVAMADARLSSRADEAPSFAIRTMLWIRGHI